MKSLFILLFFLIIIWITYNYSYNKYYSDKIEKDIKYVLLPLTIDSQFKYGELENNFRDTFEKSSINIKYIPKVNENDAPKKVS
jgi:hypothetical protein